MRFDNGLDIVAYFFKKLFYNKPDFAIGYSKKLGKYLDKTLIADDEKAVILFGEIYSRHIRKCYSYQDLTASYLSEMYMNKSDILKYTPLSPETPKKCVIRQLDMSKRYYEDCKGIFLMSHWLCDYMKKSGVIAPEKVHFVGAGCNIDVNKVDTSKKQGNKFLFIGKRFERKNGFLVVEAFNLLHKLYPDTELYIAGPQTKEECGELGDGIVFLGRKTYNELVDYYNMCDYFVMPSQFEAYGIVFGEALIYGLPCIGKNCFAMPEFIHDGDNGFLIENNDKYELMNKMQALLENREIAKNVMKRQDEYIKQYSWDATAQRIYDIIEADNRKEEVTQNAF